MDQIISLNEHLITYSLLKDNNYEELAKHSNLSYKLWLHSHSLSIENLEWLKQHHCPRHKVVNSVILHCIDTAPVEILNWLYDNGFLLHMRCYSILSNIKNNDIVDMLLNWLYERKCPLDKNIRTRMNPEGVHYERIVNFVEDKVKLHPEVSFEEYEEGWISDD